MHDAAARSLRRSTELVKLEKDTAQRFSSHGEGAVVFVFLRALERHVYGA